jgi:hypothetical protein
MHGEAAGAYYLPAAFDQADQYLRPTHIYAHDRVFIWHKKFHKEVD